MKLQSQNKAKRWLVRLGGSLIVLCLAVGGFWYWINIPPQIKIPTPVMPKPNGYDYFRRTGAAFVKDDKGVDEITDSYSTTGKTKIYPIAAKEEWLKQNAKAFQLLREGLKYPSAHPRNMPTSPYSQFRDLARALVVESHVHAEHGDWNGAADSILDGLEFAYDIPRDGPLIAGLVGIAVQAISLREMYRISPHLNAQEAKLATKRIEHLYAGRFPYFKTLQEEKWAHQAEKIKLMNEKSWRLKLLKMLNGAPALTMAITRITHTSYSPPSRIEAAKEFLKNSTFLFVSKRAFLNNYTKGMDACIANGRVPYSKMKPVPISGDVFNSTILSVFKDTRWNWARMDAQSVMNMTMLALRAYQLDNGYYPANLKELVPTYLSKIPIDPFAGNASLHYQLQGKKYHLWSIGPDGVDNHGTPIINSLGKYAANAKYRLLEPDSKGDVVAGINVP